MPDGLPDLPEITDEDIEWVCTLMRLDPLDGPRCTFLKAGSTIDVTACPGSGKTTLVVAKLAILVRKWPYKTKGICVLSHTNVAREEIQQRLCSTGIGQRLLSYPHFIDTIHGFVNRFLALPWLNSNGYPSPTIDNDVTIAFRRGVLGREYFTIQNFLERKHGNFDQLRICTHDLCFNLGGKPFPSGPTSNSFQLAKKAIEASAGAGYFCYDEMFVLARALLDGFPAATSWLKCRFPLIMLDEMQDTFELQGDMLHKLFPRSATDIVVQRVGDPNQAIFDSDDDNPDMTDPFPDSGTNRCSCVSNSHRFGSKIAEMASPFAATPVSPTGLCGIGPTAMMCSEEACPHAIFLFPKDNTAGVLDAYGKHVLTIFNDNALANGTVTAVGAIHRHKPEVTPGHDHFPQAVPHYWSGYNAEIGRKEPHPRTLLQYVQVAQSNVRKDRDISSGIDKIASGFIRLAGIIGDSGRLRRKPRTHRTIVDMLKDDPPILAIYRSLIKAFLIDFIPLTSVNWASMQNNMLAVACSLCGGVTENLNATQFLVWSEANASSNVGTGSSQDDAAPNVYRVWEGNRKVDIKLGSIHSVKGQTHLATMILSTYWYDHSSKRILPWLLGTRVNGNGANTQDRKRLLQTYVAMTRPTHMVCFAIPRFVFGNDQAIAQHVATLIGRGWRVAEIVEGNCIWF